MESAKIPFVFFFLFFTFEAFHYLFYNMTNEPSSKRVKLSLEPSIINDVMDITNTGQKILKT
jgi:hypothetical protein